MPSLEQLELNGYASDETVRSLKRLRNLKSLTLTAPDVSDRGFKSLSALSLRKLRLEFLNGGRDPQRIRPGFVDTLLSFRELEVLEIRGTLKDHFPADIEKLRAHPRLGVFSCRPESKKKMNNLRAILGPRIQVEELWDPWDGV